jgi:hypothetical protein
MDKRGNQAVYRPLLERLRMRAIEGAAETGAW